MERFSRRRKIRSVAEAVASVLPVACVRGEPAVPKRGRVGSGLAGALVFGLLLVSAVGCLGVDYLRDFEPVHPDLTISAVIENPAMSREKWEVRASGRLVREEADGRPIEIGFGPWPVNGGMIPRTLLSSELGGDGEPLDVLVFGAPLARGEVVRVRPVGLLRVIDALERDDKILAVPATPAFDAIERVEDLDARFPGARDALAQWYVEAREGRSMIDVQGFGSRAAANRLIAEGLLAYREASGAGRMPTWETR